MKKTLLATTAMGLLYAGSALAEGPTLTIGGYSDFQVGNASQESAYTEQDGNASIYSRDLHTRNETKLHFKVDGKADNGLGYGAYIELNADVSNSDYTTANDNSERSYLYVESGFGRVEAGATDDAGSTLSVSAATFARATGGIAGDFYRYADLSSDSTASNDDYYILPGLPTAAGLPGEATVGWNSATNTVNGDNHLARATANKINYYSPRIQGVQVGLSFTPDQSERGTANGFSGGNDQSFSNVWNAGINYKNQIGDVSLEGSLSGEWGTTEDNGSTATALDDLEAYAVGLNVSYAGFTVGGSYGDVPELGQTKADNTSASYWTAGIGYEFGPFGTSLTYMESTVEHQGGAAVADKEFSNISLGADYKLAPGLVPYVEVSFFDTDDNVSTTTDNSGTVFIVGTELNF